MSRILDTTDSFIAVFGIKYQFLFVTRVLNQALLLYVCILFSDMPISLLVTY